jgi:uncharacterized membrane protein YdjX (TVP38/TMEM64 family)
LAPLVMLIAALALFFAFDLERYLSFGALKENRAALQAFVAAHAWSGLAFAALYGLVIACSLPVATLMTLASGFLFGAIYGTVYAVAGATVGCILAFLAIKVGVGDAVASRLTGRLKEMEDGFRRNAFFYLLVLRLIPAFPFFLVNIAPAFLGVRLRTFALATIIGIIPGAAIYASLGSGLGGAFDRGETPDLSLIFEPQILLPLIGLALLALVPVLVRHFFFRPETRS